MCLTANVNGIEEGLHILPVDDCFYYARGGCNDLSRGAKRFGFSRSEGAIAREFKLSQHAGAARAQRPMPLAAQVARCDAMRPDEGPSTRSLPWAENRVGHRACPGRSHRGVERRGLGLPSTVPADWQFGGSACTRSVVSTRAATIPASPAPAAKASCHCRWAASAWLPVPSVGSFVQAVSLRGPWGRTLRNWKARQTPKAWRA